MRQPQLVGGAEEHTGSRFWATFQTMNTGRWLASYVCGYFFASGLNWFVAEKFLNDIIRPGFGVLMRTNESTNVSAIVFGFAIMMLVVTLIAGLLRSPRAWVARGLTAGALASLLVFGVYVFLSGWLVLPTREMCLTASADSITIVLGALVVAFVQDWRRTAP